MLGTRDFVPALPLSHAAKRERKSDAEAEAQRVLALDPGFNIRQFSVTVGIEPRVYESLSVAWRQAGLPNDRPRTHKSAFASAAR
jgi:hypothetical protein